MFEDLAAHLPPGALLVANNSRVAPARLTGLRPRRENSAEQGHVEMLLLSPPPLLEAARFEAEGWFYAEAKALLKPGKRIKEGDALLFGTGLLALVLAKEEFGKHRIKLSWRGNLLDRMAENGEIPLPPYIHRDATNEDDKTRYQTIYARADKTGSVAAPTAGLHFTASLREALAQKGFGWAEVTLHVGYGTFSPVRESDIRMHAMHGEYVEVPPATAQAIVAAKAEGRPVVAVGTTSLRTLEGAFKACGCLPDNGWQGWTDIFIYPGFQFQAVDALITNFHLPESSLLMLVSALASRELILQAYQEAINREYRFFSYGDAMLIKA